MVRIDVDNRLDQVPNMNEVYRPLTDLKEKYVDSNAERKNVFCIFFYISIGSQDPTTILSANVASPAPTPRKIRLNASRLIEFRF